MIDHGLNVLHLDADSVWFANPLPIFKTLYAKHQLIVQVWSGATCVRLSILAFPELAPAWLRTLAAVDSHARDIYMRANRCSRRCLLLPGRAQREPTKLNILSASVAER